MEKFIRHHRSTYFSAIPHDLIVELEKFFDIKMLVEDNDGICYVTIECPNLTIPLTWETMDDAITDFVEQCEEFDKIVNEISPEFNGIILPGYRITMDLHYGRHQQLTLMYEDRFCKRLFKSKLDTPMSLIIMKKIARFANDLKIDSVKRIY